MVHAADQQLSRRLLLEMTLQAERLIPRLQHLFVHRAVGVVTGDTSLAHCLVLENKRSLLRDVAADAGVIHRRQLRARPKHRLAAVRLVAIDTRHLPSQDRVAVGKIKLTAFVEVTLETRFGGTPRVHDGAGRPAALHVRAGRAMAGFTSEGVSWRERVL